MDLNESKYFILRVKIEKEKLIYENYYSFNRNWILYVFEENININEYLKILSNTLLESNKIEDKNKAI